MPITILVDFIRSLVSKSLKANEDLKHKLSMQVKAEYNPAVDEDSFTISTYKKNELLRAERERLIIETSTF